MKKNGVLWMCIILSVAGLFSGCALAHRMPLAIQDVTKPLPSRAEEIAVYFEESIPAKPLPETIWDNTTGAVWDVEESTQIGFTQTYRGGVVPTPFVVVGVATIDSRIVIPFGRNFTGVFESALKKSFSKYFLCYDTSCLTACIEQNNPSKVLRIKITSFQTWENPLNHINFQIKGSCRVLHKDGTLLKEYVFEKTMLTRPIGTTLSRAGDFIDEMNKLLNDFSADLTVEIITKLFV